jgi:polysaccharide export outer membrane protein
MRLSLSHKLIAGGLLFAAAAWMLMSGSQPETDSIKTTMGATEASIAVIRDENLQLCQGIDNGYSSATMACGCQGSCSCGAVAQTSGFGYAQPIANVPMNPNPGRSLQGVNQFTTGAGGREGKWRDSQNVPWEQMAYGEYIGPHRTPHVGEYRLRVNDQLEFVYLRTREKSLEPYQLFVGDTIQISSTIDASLNQADLVIRSDGMVSLSLIGQVMAAGKTVENLQKELNDKFTKFVKNPSIVVQVTQGETPLQDIINSVDARAGQGGQARAATVSPDGTVQLPGVGSVPAIGLTLDEIGREVNARYRLRQGGIEVTPILIQRAPRFIYVVGEVAQGGRFEMVGPTSAMQAIALAGGFGTGGNLRQAIVFRRDQNWRLTATKLDLNGALLGKRPHPSDEIWLRDSDIVLIPKKPIQRLSEAVDLYLQRTLYGIFPQQGVAFNFDDFTSL